ncbi:unnamed protein product [Ambrosiozyma monospora]|uniref:Unnamed protein product n=1 Tax=Ambrosiozyma monospora TaxID=43982 RepID=A0A9W7DH21_AMBMO|nr:unnamed protein product [Ambrosiozyma monospora]
MFKKDTGIKSLSNVKNSEKKKIYRTILQEYKLNEKLITPEIASQILPNSIKHSTFKTATGYKGTVYTDEAGVPLWFNTRDTQLIPTVFTLWKAPFLLPIIYTHDFVVERVLNGSNLMVPGTLPPFDKRLMRGAVCAIANYKDPKVAIAVGFCNVDMYKFTEVVGLSGVAVDVMQVVDDHLYKSGGKKLKIPTGDSISLPLSLEELSEHDKEASHEEANDISKDEVVEQGNDENSGAIDPVVEESNKPSQKEADVVPIEEHVAPSADDAYTLQTEDIDDFFKRSVLYSISQDKIELPISASNFMANHVLKNLPIIDSAVTIKKTSWKKTAKFLKAMEKLQLLKLKGKDDDLTILKLSDKTHELLAHFEPYKIKKQSKGKSNSEDDSNSGKLIAVQLYKATPSLRMMFNKLDLVYDDFYEQYEIKTIVQKYIVKQNLPDPSNKRNIKVDSVLAPVLNTKRPIIERSTVADLILQKGFKEHYVVLESMDDFKRSKVKKGKIPKIQVTVEQLKFGRKVVTKVVGLETFFIDPQELASLLKVKCSGSATVSPNVQNPKVVEVTVQGPHNKIVEDTLVEEFGLKPMWINFENKLKPKKKKKPAV